jgi:pilus assembly protein TadC
LFAALQLGLPLLAAGLVLVMVHGLPGERRGNWMVLVLCALGAGYLVPKRLLAAAAARRQRKIAQDVSLMIPLLRILFETGLAVEQALRVLALEGAAWCRTSATSCNWCCSGSTRAWRWGRNWKRPHGCWRWTSSSTPA